MSRPLLTARAVADMLDVHPETVLRWTRRGQLPGRRLPGGAMRYREEELNRWLDERATPTRSLPTTRSAALHGTVQSLTPTTTEDEET